MDSDFRTPPKVKNNKRKHKKPLYRPPPVLTEYSPPFSKKDSQTPEYRHQEPEYRHQLPEETISDFNIDKVIGMSGSFSVMMVDTLNHDLYLLLIPD